MAVMTALAIASLAATGVSMVQQARGARKAAKAVEAAGIEVARAQTEAGDEAKRIAEANAVQAELDALDARRRGVEDENVLSRDVRQQIGASRAGYAAQGVDVTMGTPVDLRTSGEQLLQSELVRVRRNAEREALGYTTEAANYRTAGDYAQRTARNQARATLLGAQAGATASRSAGTAAILGGVPHLIGGVRDVRASWPKPR